MKKWFIIVLFFVFQLSYSQSEVIAEKGVATIGLATPFTYQINTETLIVKNNLIFELYSVNQTEHIYFKMIDIEKNDLENYENDSIDFAVRENCDYLFLFETYSAGSNIFVQARLLDLLNSDIVFIKTYKLYLDVKVNENITFISEDIVHNILKLDLKNNFNTMNKTMKRKDTKEEKEIENRVLFTFKDSLKHEIFFMNGFLKTNPQIFTVLSLYTGYSYYPNEFFFLDVGIMGGTGKFDNGFHFSEIGFHDMFIGGFTGLHFYIKGIIEPNIGARIELIYFSNHSLVLTIPFDIGVKIFISRKHVLRINTCFPINTFNLFNSKWDKKMVLGFMVGYGFKM